MSAARLLMILGVILLACVLEYLRQVAKRKRAFSVYGGLFAIGTAVVGLLMVNAGADSLGVHS